MNNKIIDKIKEYEWKLAPNHTDEEARVASTFNAMLGHLVSDVEELLLQRDREIVEKVLNFKATQNVLPRNEIYSRAIDDIINYLEKYNMPFKDTKEGSTHYDGDQ